MTATEKQEGKFSSLCHQQPTLTEEVIFPDRYFRGPDMAKSSTTDIAKPVGDRFNKGKPELSYIFDAPLAMEGLAKRFSLGANKYGRDNWKRGLVTNEIIDSLLRHLSAYQRGEIMDEDGGEHVDAIVWNAVVLSEQSKRGVKL